MKKTVKVTPFWQEDNYEANYGRTYSEYNCEICGRKLNPKTMKWVQMLECGYWTLEEREVKEVADDFGRSQGCFCVGPKCYAEIRRRIAASTETRDIIIND